MTHHHAGAPPPLSRPLTNPPSPSSLTSLYNPMLDLTCSMRLIAEMPIAGGVMTSVEVELDKLYQNFKVKDWTLKILIGMFYFYYFVLELLEMKEKGPLEFFSRPNNYLMIINIVRASSVCGVLPFSRSHS
jgi:hypothetical protein